MNLSVLYVALQPSPGTSAATNRLKNTNANIEGEVQLKLSYPVSKNVIFLAF